MVSVYVLCPLHEEYQLQRQEQLDIGTTYRAIKYGTGKQANVKELHTGIQSQCTGSDTKNKTQAERLSFLWGCNNFCVIDHSAEIA
jgi:hypothetical protein